MNFGLIGNGKIAKKHKEAIKSCGGRITKIHDPRYSETFPLGESFFRMLDYTVICSPSYLHREHTELSLAHNVPAIVEKPASMPWEPMINDNRINIVLQLRWLDLPEHATVVDVAMVRDSEYFKGWVGDSMKTGGMFYHLFIHYIDLAIRLRSKFVGHIKPSGKQYRYIKENMNISINLEKVNMNELYIKMYNDIVNRDRGVKPKDLFFLNWILEKSGWDYGFTRQYTGEGGVKFDFTGYGKK
jgi:hypothetical protein